MNTMTPGLALLGEFGGGEILLILFVCLLLFGSKGLPKIARNLGRSLEEFKKAARDVSHEIMHADADEKPAVNPPLPPPVEARKLPDQTVPINKDQQG